MSPWDEQISYTITVERELPTMRDKRFHYRDEKYASISRRREREIFYRLFLLDNFRAKLIPVIANCIRYGRKLHVEANIVREKSCDWDNIQSAFNKFIIDAIVHDKVLSSDAAGVLEIPQVRFRTHFQIRRDDKITHPVSALTVTFSLSEILTSRNHWVRTCERLLKYHGLIFKPYYDAIVEKVSKQHAPARKSRRLEDTHGPHYPKSTGPRHRCTPDDHGETLRQETHSRENGPDDHSLHGADDRGRDEGSGR